MKIPESERLVDQAAGLLLGAHDELVQADPAARIAKARALAQGAIQALNWAEFVASAHYTKPARKKRRKAAP